MDSVELFLCNICNVCYFPKRSFLLHYRSHKSLQCKVCNQVFILKRDLNAHLRTHGEIKQKYTCADCGKELFSMHQVKWHKKWHEDKRRAGKVLDSRSCDYGELKEFKIFHKNDACGARVLKEPVLKGQCCNDPTIHYLKHSAITHQCSVCNEVFNSEAVLKRHSEAQKDAVTF